MLPHLLATFFGVGHLRPAPGTWGSLAALPVAYGVATVCGPMAFAAATVAVFAAGIWATAETTRAMAEKDPPIVVIDEVAGQWLTLWPVVFQAASSGVALYKLWPGWVAAFFLFRFFDIMKPWPASYFDRLKTPFGVMADDIVAGFYSAFCVVVLTGLAHGL